MPILCLDVKSKRCALSNNKFVPSISNLTASPTENNNPGVRTTLMLIYIWSCNHKFASISLFQNPYICRTGSSAYDKHHNNVTATILRCPQQTKVTSSKSWSFLNSLNAKFRFSWKSFHLRQSFFGLCIFNFTRINWKNLNLSSSTLLFANFCNSDPERSSQSAHSIRISLLSILGSRIAFIYE